MKIAVFDIGTRATRLIIGDTDDLNESGFRFADYFNKGALTEAGLGIYPIEDGREEFQIIHLQKTIAFIANHLKICQNKGVLQENIHAVGTEVFRRVYNWRDLVSTIESVTGLRVKVLDPNEEADTTFWAAMISCQEYYERSEPFLVIEQGGGSMQLTAASVNENGVPTRHGQTSIPELGTVLLRQRFVGYQDDLSLRNRRRVETMNREVQEFASRLLQDHLTREFNLQPEQIPACAFALGSVITNFYKEVDPTARSNKVQHGKGLPLARLLTEPAGNVLFQKYARREIGSLFKDAQDLQLDENEIKAMLEQLYGLPCYGKTLQYFNLDSLRICGTGLRYGVLFKAAYGQWNEVKEFQG